MYNLPQMKRCLMLLAAGSGLLGSLFLTGCATTGGKKNTAKTDEALYLFDDGTGDLPAVENYAGADSGAELNFTESEQIAPSPVVEPTKKRGRETTQYAANTPPPPAPQYPGGNIMDHGGSDVVSTPPMPVTPGSNYGNAYAESDSGAVEPVSTQPKRSTASADDDAPAPKKKKTSSASTRTYVVKRGDTLSEIAGRYGTTVSKIKSLNGMSGTRIMIGQKLKISGSGATATATSGKKKSGSSSSKTASRHTVRSGDNLWDISRKYGVSVTALKSANGMSSSNITPGQKLKIP